MPATKPTHLNRIIRLLPGLLCLAGVAACYLMIDLKGISTDEGFRLWIINGGQGRAADGTATASYETVLNAVEPYAYQPGYYLLQNTLMRLFERQDVLFFRHLNVALLALCLLGLMRLSRDWSVWPRAFLIGFFAFNSYLIMHVLQIREYIAAVAFYIWSTGLVLSLDRRRLDDEWADIGWFAGYGVLLTLGFYVQTWVVFPAIGQGIFLIFRRRPQFWRFNIHLALSYVLVFSLTWPYLKSHVQKINIGLWERAHVTLSGQLHQGFNLVLSGHLPGHDRFTGLLPVAWLALLGIGFWCWLCRRETLAQEYVSECSRHAWLMILCICLPLAFQVAYFLKVEPLSVWPRYFIVHYFFLTWLIALAFRTLHAVCAAGSVRRLCQASLLSASSLVAISAIYQVRSYWHDPYFDTSLTPASDWRVGTAALAPLLRPDDALLAHDFITGATMTFTHPQIHPVLLETDLAKTDLNAFRRVVYLEAPLYQSSTARVVAHLASLGFVHQAEPVVAPNGQGTLPEWRVFIFSRELQVPLPSCGTYSPQRKSCCGLASAYFLP